MIPAIWSVESLVGVKGTTNSCKADFVAKVVEAADTIFGISVVVIANKAETEMRQQG